MTPTVDAADTETLPQSESTRIDRPEHGGASSGDSRVLGWLVFGGMILCVLVVRHCLSVTANSRLGSSSANARELGEFRLDLNAATPAQLQALPEVGPRLANRIVLYRNEQGPFQGVDELLDVRGIGPATLKQLRSMLHVETVVADETDLPSETELAGESDP